MSLRVWLPLNGDTHNQGLSNITVTNNGATIDNSGKIGKCYEFDGTDDYLSLDNLTCSGWSEFSVTCWVYPTAAFNYLFLIRGGGAHRVRISGDGFMFRDSNYSSQRIIGFGTTISQNVWSHIACIYNRGEIFIYINGILTAHNTNYYHSDSVLLSDQNEIRIARQQSSSGNSYYTGKINDFRIYDHALSELEVKEIARGLILHYPLNNNGMGNKNLLTNDWNLTAWSKESGISVSWDDTVGMYKVLDSSHTSSRWGIYQNITLTANTTYTFSIDGMKKYQNVNFGFAEGTSWPANAGSFTTTVSRLSKTITVGSADANCRIYLNINPVSNGSNYGYFRAPKLEIGSVATPWGPHTDNTIEYDISGYCNNGTKIGTFTYSTDTPKYNLSTYINATSTANRIESINDIILPTDGITASLWVKTSSKATNQVLLATSQIEIGLLNSLCYVKTSSTVGFTTTNFINNAWNHMVAVRTGDIYKLYINGIQETQSGASNYYLHNKNSLYLFNRSYNNNYAANASLSDVRIYATALSARDILSLYHNSALVDEQGIIHGAIH